MQEQPARRSIAISAHGQRRASAQVPQQRAMLRKGHGARQ
jgi:hypothetical protein